MMPILHSPAVIIPGQLGPISRVCVLDNARPALPEARQIGSGFRNPKIKNRFFTY
ncbi:MAG: hypothetical protein OXR07_08780 [Nitrospira sp.]|nr:hypothetical protein [Nitrospira sp.]